MNVSGDKNKGLSPGILQHQDDGEQEENCQSALRGAVTEAEGKLNLEVLSMRERFPGLNASDG